MRILSKNRDLIFIEKSIGEGSQPDKTAGADVITLLADELRSQKENSSLWLVHRLDRVVGGVMVYARNKKYSAILSSLAKPRYMNVWDIVAQDEKEIGIITFADLDLNKEDIGLGGSPTKVKSTATKQFNKTIETLELDPESAAKAIVDALKERHLI